MKKLKCSEIMALFKQIIKLFCEKKERVSLSTCLSHRFVFSFIGRKISILLIFNVNKFQVNNFDYFVMFTNVK